MYLTSDYSIGGRKIDGMPEDLSYIVKYGWQSPKHLKEAIKVLLSARLLENENTMERVFNAGEPDFDHTEVQSRLASNPYTSHYVLHYLSKIGGARVCELIATNPRCAESTMEDLADHSDPEVRAALTENSFCSITVLYKLAKDAHPDVRYRLAENLSVPLSILEELSEDENPFVAARAQASLSKLEPSAVIEMKLPSIHAFSISKAACESAAM